MFRADLRKSLFTYFPDAFGIFIIPDVSVFGTGGLPRVSLEFDLFSCELEAAFPNNEEDEEELAFLHEPEHEPPRLGDDAVFIFIG